jgi:hypothetical protein
MWRVGGGLIGCVCCRGSSRRLAFGEVPRPLIWLQVPFSRQFISRSALEGFLALESPTLTL